MHELNDAPRDCQDLIEDMEDISEKSSTVEQVVHSTLRCLAFDPVPLDVQIYGLGTYLQKERCDHPAMTQLVPSCSNQNIAGEIIKEIATLTHSVYDYAQDGSIRPWCKEHYDENGIYCGPHSWHENPVEDYASDTNKLQKILDFILKIKG